MELISRWSSATTWAIQIRRYTSSNGPINIFPDRPLQLYLKVRSESMMSMFRKEKATIYSLSIQGSNDIAAMFGAFMDDIQDQTIRSIFWRRTTLEPLNAYFLQPIVFVRSYRKQSVA